MNNVSTVFSLRSKSQPDITPNYDWLEGFKKSVTTIVKESPTTPDTTPESMVELIVTTVSDIRRRILDAICSQDDYYSRRSGIFMDEVFGTNWATDTLLKLNKVFADKKGVSPIELLKSANTKFLTDSESGDSLFTIEYQFWLFLKALEAQHGQAGLSPARRYIELVDEKYHNSANKNIELYMLKVIEVEESNNSQRRYRVTILKGTLSALIVKLLKYTQTPAVLNIIDQINKYIEAIENESNQIDEAAFIRLQLAATEQLEASSAANAVANIKQVPPPSDINPIVLQIEQLRKEHKDAREAADAKDVEAAAAAAAAAAEKRGREAAAAAAAADQMGREAAAAAAEIRRREEAVAAAAAAAAAEQREREAAAAAAVAAENAATIDKILLSIKHDKQILGLMIADMNKDVEHFKRYQMTVFNDFTFSKKLTAFYNIVVQKSEAYRGFKEVSLLEKLSLIVDPNSPVKGADLAGDAITTNLIKDEDSNVYKLDAILKEIESQISMCDVLFQTLKTTMPTDIARAAESSSADFFASAATIYLEKATSRRGGRRNRKNKNRTSKKYNRNKYSSTKKIRYIRNSKVKISARLRHK